MSTVNSKRRAVVGGVSTLALTPAAALGATGNVAAKPNILFILADDQLRRHHRLLYAQAGRRPNVKDDLYEGKVPVSQAGYYIDLPGDRAANFIDKQDRSKPFFPSLRYIAPHWPWEGPKDDEVSRSVGGIFHYDGGIWKPTDA
ncbi:hypothetical protein [Duganella sp. Root336D2]|uniref:hypothetical protein n=1 Tax=Duganella sp. Root336D2 TaxID=1736518 RepID=UPI0006F52811|nr:hypothetical protein [Duganella sp. Root336D2]KQV44900.1 hypothetical protein ASD07_20380 [Duganella sp. Root336D2]